MLIAIASVKGAPGATTFALGLTALWPSTDAILVEADGSGGVLADRFRRPIAPGLAELVTDMSRSTAACDLGRYAQQLACGADAVLAPSGGQAQLSVETLSINIDSLRCGALSRPVILDLGRLSRPSPAFDLATAADHVVLVVSGGVVAHRAQLGWLLPRLPGATLVRAHTDGYRSADTAWGHPLAPVIGELPRSSVAAGVLTGGSQFPGWRGLSLSRRIRGIGRYLAATTPARHYGLTTDRPSPCGADASNRRRFPINGSRTAPRG